MYTKYKNYRVNKQRQAAGKRYEAFVAKTLRQARWEVVENGRDGMRDHGIDLIASKDGVRRYIQCKYWKREDWLIGEDVVSHLYGSVAAIEGPENLEGVELYIYSPAQLESYAAREAEKLRIKIDHLDYPEGYNKRRFHSYYRRRAKHHWQ